VDQIVKELFVTYLEDRLRDAAECYCPDGYENNDGGYGSLTVYLLLGLAGLEHRDCYEDTEDMDGASAPMPPALHQRLTVLGVTSVTARFDGYGDSGHVEDLAVEPASVALGDELSAELEDFLLGILPAGWEINEGGYGTFAVDVAAGRAEAEGSWCVGRESDPKVTRWKWRA
jgi:hypothetical protein